MRSLGLTALNQRLTPMIEGKVIYVSADTVVDQGARRTGEQEAARRDLRSSSECVLTGTMTCAIRSRTFVRRRECPLISSSKPGSGRSLPT